MLFCCLRRNVEVFCHTLHRRLQQSTNSATYQRLVSSTRHGPSQLSVLRFAFEQFAARDGARYWLRITTFVYLPVFLAALRGPRRNIAITFGT